VQRVAGTIAISHSPRCCSRKLQPSIPSFVASCWPAASGTSPGRRPIFAPREDLKLVNHEYGNPTRPPQPGPEFFEADGRRLFGLHVARPGRFSLRRLRAGFREEMNRCRSHAASQARALAATGVHCLLIDLYGTGESDGGFEDATWISGAMTWLLRRACAATHRPCADALGMRTGALLAAEVAAAAHDRPPRLLFWQPVLDGKLFLNQYLRLRIASQMVSESERETTEQIRARLTRGEVLEIAGYPLTRTWRMVWPAAASHRWRCRRRLA